MSEIKEKMIQASKDLKFRNELLNEAIHQCYLSDQFSNWEDQAARFVRNKGLFQDDRAYILLMVGCLHLNKFQKFISLIKYLKKINHFYLSEPNNDNYYEFFLKERVTRGKAALKKLRPFVLEEVSKWSDQRRLDDLNKEQFAPYLKGWYK